MRLVSMLTENYVEKARPFLKSLSRITGIEKCVVGLGFGLRSLQDFQQEWSHGGTDLEFYVMLRHWSESSCGIMQQGRWLDALPDVRDDEVYLLSDADIIVQRDFTPEERQRFESCGENSFLVGWNAHIGDTLYEEAERIGMKQDGSFVSEGSWGNCFNTGVLAMRGRSWKRLRDLYESRCERFYRMTTHRSRGQWLMCWCLAKLGMKPEILLPDTHAHGHHGMPPGVTIRNGVAYYRDRVVMFRHAM